MTSASGAARGPGLAFGFSWASAALFSGAVLSLLSWLSTFVSHVWARRSIRDGKPQADLRIRNVFMPSKVREGRANNSILSAFPNLSALSSVPRSPRVSAGGRNTVSPGSQLFRVFVHLLWASFLTPEKEMWGGWAVIPILVDVAVDVLVDVAVLDGIVIARMRLAAINEFMILGPHSKRQYSLFAKHCSGS